MTIALYLSLAAIAGLVNANLVENINLKPGDDIKLEHQRAETLNENKWNLQTCDGCKISVNCVILNPSCGTHKITIFDGKETHDYCGRENRFILKSSFSNSMTVTIETSSDRLSSYCKVLATKPYLNDKFVKRDSSEDGQQPGKKSPSCNCGWTNKPNKRIVGGDEAGPNEYPFPVLLGMMRTNAQFCGGSIISNKHILTAAHCTFPFRGIKLAVFIGEHDVTLENKPSHVQKIAVNRVFEHEEYDDNKAENDIAVLELEEDIKFSRYVGPVCLPTSPPDILGQYIKVMGWGHTKTNGTASDVLLKVDLKVIDWDICRVIYNTPEKFRPTQFCTWSPNKDSCQGDSGGPLVWLDPDTNRYTQIAVVSYGKTCASTDPGVNSNVYYYLDWIMRIIRNTGGTVCMA